MLLLPKLVEIWLPDDNAAHQSPLSEQAPRSQIPPLISFLEGLPDVITPDKSKGKNFPCGHVVCVKSVLSLLNFFGDSTWTPGPHSMYCAQPECKETLEFPKLPNPQVLDGLEARLDLIQYSWNKDAPTELDVHAVSLLRDILSRIGHSGGDQEPETDADVSQSAPSEPPPMQTLANMEMEAFGLMVLNQGKSAETPLRGTQPYCSFREATKPTPGQSLRYTMASPGQYCECVVPHDYERQPSRWALTPAETDVDVEMQQVEKPQKSKTVRFVASVVTEVQFFEPWWCAEYRDSGRYYSTGPHKRSTDTSTKADDEWQIELIENPEGSAAQISGDMNGEGSDCSTVVDADEILDRTERDDDSVDDEIVNGMERIDELLDEMERADDSLDDEILDEMERVNESWDDEILDETERINESLDEMERASEPLDDETLEDMRNLHGASEESLEEWF